MDWNMSKETTGEISRRPPTMTSFEWKIHDFSARFLRKRDHCIKSPLFSFLDAEWRLEIHINSGGSMMGLIDWISFYVIKDHSITQSHRVGYRVSIRQQDGTHYGSLIDVRNFDKDGAGFGSNKWLQLSPLLKIKGKIAPQDTVTIFTMLHSNVCESKEVASQAMNPGGRSVSTETSEEDLKKTEILSGCEKKPLFTPTGADKLALDLKNLILNEQECDVTIKINKRDFKAHRLILGARSPVFSSMFSHDTTERNTGVVNIEDCHSDIFQIFLMFLYSGEMQEFTSDNLCDLYVVAEKYDVQELKWKCIKYLSNDLSVGNFCDVMSLALRYKEYQLIKLATDFFMKNAKRIILTTQWQCFHKEYPVECNELHIKTLAHLVPE